MVAEASRPWRTLRLTDDRAQLRILLLALLAGCGSPETGTKTDTAAADTPPTDSKADTAETGDTSPDSEESGGDTQTAETGGDTGGDSATDTDTGAVTDTDPGPSGGDFAPETSASDALARIISDKAGTDLGRIVKVGDADGDGQLDVVTTTLLDDGRTGGGYVLPGPLTTSGAAEALGLHLTGAVRNSGTGRSLSLGDVDGDGYADIGLGAPYDSENNGVYLAFGPTTGDVSLGDPSVALLRGPRATYAGHGSDLSGDLNDDGIDDAVVGAYYTSSEKGLTFVVFGPVHDGLDLETDADVRLEGEAATVYAGRSVRAGADLDGDGVGDLVIACLGTMGLPASGGFYVVYSPLAGDIDLADADGRYAGDSYSGAAGLWLDAADLDGDGLADIVAAGLDSTLATSAGVAYVVLGPASADTNLAGADLVVRGDVAGSYGGGVAMGDLDGDGTAELLLGVQGDATAGVAAGAVYLFSDPSPGSYVFSDGDAAFTGEGPGDSLGTGMAVGDVDGDGIAEIVMGAPYQDDGGTGAGAFYVMHSL